MAESQARQKGKDTFAALPRKARPRREEKGHIDPSGIRVTDKVGQILDNSWKFAVHPHATAAQLFGMVNADAGGLPEKLKAAGIDEGVRCAMLCTKPRGSGCTTKEAIRFLRQRHLTLHLSDKTDVSSS